ncbi:T9SS type A sorting domain-containing protein [Candidatus Latescibacterota bacterium]
MKKILLVTFAVMMISSVSFAVWSPTPLEITVQDEIIYPFDGTAVDITVNVTGKPCKAYLWINTRLGDAKPDELTNGNRGWHYVNKIDTTVYISGPQDLVIATGQTISWDGVGSENGSREYGGNIEPSAQIDPGTYDYYVFGWDDENPREIVCNYLAISFYWYSQYTRVGQWEDDRTPRDTPYLWGNICWMYNNMHRTTDDDGNYVPREGWLSYGPPRWTAFKFPIGSDPDDMDALITTFMPGFNGDTDPETGDPLPTQLDSSPIVFDPDDEMVFYCLHDLVTQKNGAMFKWDWVTGGDATIDDSWGGWDELAIATASERGMGEYYTGSATDGNYIYITSPGRDASIKWDKFYVVSFDGDLVADQMLDDFYTPDHPQDKYRNGMINRMYAEQDVPWQSVMGGEQHCMAMMVHTDRLADGETDYVKWINTNGDFFMDNAWDPIDTPAEELWQCNHGDFRTINGGRHDELWFDGTGATIQHPDYHGLTSFCVLTQDGSGVAYGQFADDTVSMDSADGDKKGSGQRCDNGTIYDGFYTGFKVFEGGGYGANNQNVTWFGQDSAHGVISDVPVVPEAVEEAGQAAFSVAAAYPNPANPTTTISFTLAEAGHVTVDIYNVAGQKVNTLVNGELSIGSHSVVWDASGFSAGVYFYTVTSGDFSKTMKVTLLK